MTNFSNLGTKLWLKYQSKWHYYSQYSLGDPSRSDLQVRESVLLQFLSCIVLLLDFKGTQMIELSKVIITLLMSSCFRKFWSILGSNPTSYRAGLQNGTESWSEDFYLLFTRNDFLLHFPCTKPLWNLNNSSVDCLHRIHSLRSIGTRLQTRLANGNLWPKISTSTSELLSVF